jgi:transposase/transcription elongation factor Elf1
MLIKQSMNGRNQFAMMTIDDLVPKDHLVRKIDAAIDFDFVYPVVEATYSTIGRPSIDPVVLIKLVFIQYLFGLRSMRQTIKEVETNVAYRWFLGYSFEEKVPHFSTFGKNYVRRFRETTLFEDIFAHILEQAVKSGFVTEENLYIDSTHIKANANKHKFTKEMTYGQAKAYQDELENEINAQRIEAGKRPFIWSTESELIPKKTSTSDPESGYYVKGEKEKQFAYSAHTACDDNGFVLGTLVTPGNIHDSQAGIDLVRQLKRSFPNSKHVIADAGYKTSRFVYFLTHLKLRAILPYTRPRGTKGMFRKIDFIYDDYFDCYLCPEARVLSFSTITREGYREYKSDSRDCERCPLLTNCTLSKTFQKVITRHIWSSNMEEIEHQRHTALNKKLYPKRKQTIERIFADAKEKHGMRWTKYRGLEKVATHTMLTFAAMNLKKLATWLWRTGKSTTFHFEFIQKIVKKGVGLIANSFCLQSEKNKHKLILFLFIF